MDHAEYRRRVFADPPPGPRLDFDGPGGPVLFVHPYEVAVAFSTEVLGPPVYVEGDHTRGRPIGDAWLTLFPATSGAPGNTEIGPVMDIPDEADRLHTAFLDAGATGEPPSDRSMYEPIRSAALTDPFGTRLPIWARRPEG